jgi:hypothetical protein
MKFAVLATFAIMTFATGAVAGEISFPSDAPVASVTFPMSWESEETDTGVQGTSPEDAVYVSADLADGKSVDKAVSDSVDFLVKNGVDIDADSAKNTEGTVNGMSSYFVDWSGKDKDGPVSVGLAAVVMNEKTILVLTYWGSKDGEDKFGDDVKSIVQSIKPAE